MSRRDGDRTQTENSLHGRVSDEPLGGGEMPEAEEPDQQQIDWERIHIDVCVYVSCRYRPVKAE